MGNGEAEEVDGDFIGGVFRIEDIVRWREHASWNTLYPLPAQVLCAIIGLLPHVLPIRSSVL